MQKVKRPVGKPPLGKDKLIKRPFYMKQADIVKLTKKAEKYSMSLNAYIRSILLREIN